MNDDSDPRTQAAPGAAPEPDLHPTLPTPHAAGAGRPSGPGVLDRLGEVFASRYALGKPIARGGIGQVVTAEDLALHREVAVKELLDDQNAAARGRFEREALLTARLEHPGIVAVHEFGRRPDGEAYLVMRKVHGKPFTRAIADAVRLEDRLALLPSLIAIADAVGYAHGQGVVHRDLKPSNVLLGQHGETVVIDWGLAKDLRAAPDDGPGAAPLATPQPPLKDGSGSGAGLTVAGSLLGTPEYMSPEQARGEPADERSDVYALGVMLYHALSGEPPYRGLTGAAVLLAVHAGPPEPLAARAKGLAPELVAIVGRAMARERARRYANAAELAADLRRFQTGQLVLAHSYSVGALVSRWVRRNAALLTVGAVAVALLAVVAGVSVQRVLAERDRANAERDRANLERDRANREAEASKRVATFLTDMFRVSDPERSRGKTVTARELLDHSARSIEHQLEKDPLVRAQLLVVMGGAYAALGLDDQALPLLENAVETRARLLGPEAPDTLAARVELATALPEFDAKAVDLDRETLALCQRVLGAEHPVTLHMMNLLGNALMGVSRDEEAEALLRKSVELHRKVDGPRSFSTGTALAGLGVALSHQKRYAEATALQSEALAIFKAEDGANSTFALRSAINLAADEWSAGEPARALAHQLEALGIVEQVFGREHPTTLQQLNNIANSYSSLGRFADAEQTLDRVIAGARKLGDKQLLALSLYNRACVAARQGHEPAAQADLREAFSAGLPPPVAQHLGEDPDLASLRGRPWFQAMLEEAKKLHP